MILSCYTFGEKKFSLAVNSNIHFFLNPIFEEIFNKDCGILNIFMAEINIYLCFSNFGRILLYPTLRPFCLLFIFLQ